MTRATCTMVATALVIGAGCNEPDTGPGEDQAAPSEEVGEATHAARTAGEVAQYIHTSTNQGITLEEEYTTWGTQWHTIIQAGLDNQLFFYNRLDGTVKTYLLGSTGTLTFQQQYTLPTTIDFWVRGNFTGTSAKEVAGYDGSAGLLRVYEVSSTGLVTLKLSQIVGQHMNLGFAGYWGNGTYDDIAVYNKSEGTTKYYASNGVSSFSVARTVTYQKIWDHIVPGRFNTDSLTDLFFYNQDSGEYKVHTMDSDRVGTLTDSGSELPGRLVGEEKVVPYAVFVKGEFGGSSQTDDLLFYDQRTGAGRFFLSSTSATLSAGTRHTGWQKKWTHIIPVKQSGSATTDLLYYSNSYDISVKLVRLADDIFGTNRAQVSTVEFERWIDTANDTYRAAGIRFVWDGVINDRIDVALNAYTCETDSDDLKKHADDLAESYYDAPNNLVVFARGNDPSSNSGDGCGSPARQYIMMPGFTQTSTVYRTYDGGATDSFGSPITPGLRIPTNLKLFAHEAGHYFGLDHVSVESSPVSATSIYAFDNDWAACCTFTSVLDTPPSPPVSDWNSSSGNICDDSPAGEISVTLAGGSANLNPERHNVMLNGTNCDRTYRLSPGQVNAIRTNLFSNRLPLTQ